MSSDSPLASHLTTGDVILFVNGIDVSGFTAKGLTRQLVAHAVSANESMNDASVDDQGSGAGT